MVSSNIIKIHYYRKCGYVRGAIIAVTSNISFCIYFVSQIRINYLS